jgi:hypothetical protein
VIRRRLIESGGNDGLFGRDSRGRLVHAIREDDEGEGAAGLMRSAGGKQDSEAMADRRRLFDGYDAALRAGDEESADEYHEALKDHHRQQGAAVGAEQSRAANISRESREAKFGFRDAGGNARGFRVQRGRTAGRPRSAEARSPVPTTAAGWMARLLG